MSLDEYRRSKVRFAFVGLGHNTFGSQRFRHGAALSRLLAAAAERGDPFSVRNDGSLARLARDVGAASDAVCEVPDPGFFVGSSPLRPVEVSDRPYALLQVAGESLSLRLGGGLVRRIAYRISPMGIAWLANALAEWGVRYWREHGLDILVTPHLRTDVPLAGLVLQKLYSKAGSAAFHRPFRLGGTPHPLHATQFFGGYAAAELVVGMRGHAVICGVGLRRPVVALSTHPKIAGFMDACGLGEWSVPPSPDLADALSAKTDALRCDGPDAYFAARDRAVASYADRLDAFLKAALAGISSPANIEPR